MTTMECDVAILGAGPTGLTVANLLGQAGVRVVLIERNQGTVEAPRAVSIDDESLRTMQAIALADAVIKDVALDYGSYYFSPSGECFAKVEPTTREYGFPRRSAFAQPRLEATLRAALERFSSVETLFGCRCETVREHDSGVTLALTMQAGTNGESKRTIRARYLVACDGARSAIRKQIGATLAGSTYRQRWLIVDLASTKERLRQTRIVCNPDRPLITLPGPGGTRRYEFMLRDGESEEAAVDPDFVHGLLAAHGPDADAPVVRRQVYAFHARVVDRWSTRRIFLAGDAAHLSPPFAGQGMNSGIRDAHNLGWKLAEVVKGRLGPTLLETYQVERAPHASVLIQLAINIGRVMMPASHAQAFAVRSGFRLAGLVPGLQDYFAQMKFKPKPFYRDGFVIPQDGELNLTGRMLPQPSVELMDRSRKMLDACMGNGFCLIAYGVDAQRTAAAAARLDFGLSDLRRLAILPSIYNPDPDIEGTIETVRDHAGAFASVISSDRDVLILVRPDRYVAAATQGTPAGMHELAAATKALVARTRMSNEDEGTRSAA
jgi:3-(3-hydroxy-phenyl)propionate hydroxylase